MRKSLITVHLLLVIVAYTSWIWLDWRIIVALASGHLIMLEILKGCPLSHLQFPTNKDQRFYEWWLGKLGFDVASSVARRRKARIFMQYILPVVIIGLALLLQLVFSVSPVATLPL